MSEPVSDQTNQIKQHVLVAEDEQNIAEILQAYLKKEGYAVTIASDGQSALALAASGNIDLMLLDIMLPKMMGFDVLAQLREKSGIPVILITSLGNETHRLKGFELGADDYICKPFSPREVMARVKSLMRRAYPLGQPHTSHNQDNQMLQLDDKTHSVKILNEQVELTAFQFRLLRVFVAHPNRIFSRDQLLDEVTGICSESSYRAIDSHIKNLRKKLGQAAPKHHIIQSVYGVGYKLNLPFLEK